jgi:hypothetical protein
MPIYTCKKCGYAVRSKNIMTRSSFPVETEGGDDARIQNMTLMAVKSSSYMKCEDDPHRPVLEGRREKAGQDVVLRITIHDYKDSTHTPEEAILDWVELFSSLSETKKKQFLCESFGRHEYEADGEPTC